MAVGSVRDATTKRNKTKGREEGEKDTRESETRNWRNTRSMRETERERERGGEITRRDAKESASFGRGTNDKEYL